MRVEAFLEATLRTAPNANGSSRTLVGIPPSHVDAVSDMMRVAWAGYVIERAFDPGEGVGGATLSEPYVTLADEPYVTLADEPYVTVGQ